MKLWITSLYLSLLSKVCCQSFGLTWTLQPSAPIGNWDSICSDSSGKYLAATASAIGSGGAAIYISSTSGVSWTLASAPQVYWFDITSDSTGQYLAATFDGGNIYTSSNYGLNFIQSQSPSNPWTGIASDSTGMYLAAVTYGSGIYTSSTYGDSWTQQYSTGYYWDIASSSSGAILVAVINVNPPTNSGILTSYNSGGAWSVTSTSVDAVAWTGVAMSSNGENIIAVGSDAIWISTNSCESWSNSYSFSNVYSATSDSTGQYLAATQKGGSIAYSTNMGNSWQHIQFQSMFNVVISGTALVMAAVANEGGIYTSFLYSPTAAPTTMPTTAAPTTAPSCQPSTAPSTAPSCQPSVSPSCQPTTAIPTAKPSLQPLDTLFTVYNSTYTHENYWNLTTLFSLITSNQSLYLDVISSQNILVNQGQIISIGIHGLNTTYFNCSLADTCDGTQSCLTNYKLNSYIIDAQGGSLTISFKTICDKSYCGTSTCVQGSSALYFLSMGLSTLLSPTLSPTILATSQPISVASFCTSITQNHIWYYYIFFILGFVCLGVAIHSVRIIATKELLVFSRLMIVAEMSILGFDFISGFMYILTLYESYRLVGPATVLIIVRIFHPFIGCYILKLIIGTNKQNSLYIRLIDNDNLAQNAKMYGLLMFAALFEPTSIKFLPWLQTEYSNISGGYPDMFTFRLCGYSKMAQTMISALIQIVILVRLNKDISSGSCIMILTLTFVSTMLVVLVTLFEIFFQATNTYKKEEPDMTKTEIEMDELKVVRIDDVPNPIFCSSSRSEDSSNSIIISSSSIN